MIHSVFVDSTTTPNDLRKLFRKRLMTGGGVIRLQPTLSSAELQTIVGTFSAEASEYNLAGEVLRQVAKHPAATPELRALLEATGLRRLFAQLRGSNA